MARRGFGAIRKLPSGRFQASYIGPDMARHLAPETFTAKIDAEAWLASERRMVEWDEWTSPTARLASARAAAELQTLTLRRFVEEQWFPSLELRPASERDYKSLLKNHIYPTLGERPLVGIDRAEVRAWWSRLDPTKPRARSKAYQLLHNLMNGALDLELIEANPVRLPKKKAGRSKRAKRVQVLTVEEIHAIADAMPERLRMAVLLGAWCALRYGELSELRRKDIDVEAGLIHVERGVVKVAGGYHVGEPKTEAGDRFVNVPAALLPELRRHLIAHAAWGTEGLLFPAPNGGHMHSTTFARAFRAAAESIGRPDATPHTLRHTGASLATSVGATTADAMARLGHTSPSMAMLYQHSLPDADARLTGRLSLLLEESKRAGRVE